MKKAVFCIYALFVIAGSLHALSKDPVIQYVEQATIVFNLGRYEEAIELYDIAIKMNSNAADAYLGKGNCYAMMNNNLQAQKMYEKALLIDPTLKIPDLSWRKNIAKQRGVNADKIRAKYYALIGKGEKTEETDAVAETEPAAEAKVTEKTKQEIKQVQEERELWSRGGRARTTALGGIELVSPDISTALDGASRGIEAGLLFRREKHFFNFQPFVGKTGRVVKYPDGSEEFGENFAADINDSLFEIGWPNKNFMNSIRPLYTNSYMLRTTAGPDSRESNTGNLFGGEYIAGFKPIPLFGIAGRIGYEYSPYQESDGTKTAGITTTGLKWNVSSGIFLPYIFNQTDELDITASFGTYSPRLNLSDLSNENLKNLPYSMKDGVSRKYTITTPILPSDPILGWLSGLGVDLSSLDAIKKEDSVTIESTGYDIKGNIHYMIGNGQHEIALFIGAPSLIEYKMNTTEEYKGSIAGAPVPITASSTNKVIIGKERGFEIGAAVRSNIKYVIPALKYGQKYTENYMYSSVPGVSITGKNITRQHNIVTGINIAPVEQFAMPLEYEYDYLSFENAGIRKSSVRNEVRGGIEVKPVSVIALRGGMSYSFTRFDGTGMAPSGRQGNPFINSLGYHFGGGFDMPMFELNAGGSYKKIYESPSPAGSKITNGYFFYGFVDLNVYI